MVTIAPFGTWTSPLSPEVVSSSQVGLVEPHLERDVVTWIETRPAEGGRCVLVRRTPGGQIEELAPPLFSTRTRVHEYGGGAYAVREGVTVVVNDHDQRLYRLEPGAARPLTPESGRRLRFADLELDLRRRRVLAVREDHCSSGEPVNTLVAVALDGGEEAGRVLTRGHDFFSSPRLSPDGRRLAWLSWDHPSMPWDETSLWLGSLAPDGALTDVRRVAGGAGESIVQPEWSPDGVLHFVSDRDGWWNIFRLTDDEPVNVCRMSAEFAGPAWTFGARWYAFLDNGAILACHAQDGEWRLGVLRPTDGRLEPWPLPFTHLSGPRADRGRAVVRAGAPDRPASIVLLDPERRAHCEIACAGALAVDPGSLSRPTPISWDGPIGRVHAFLYRPHQPGFRAPAGERPPLIVKSHGGPTGATSSELRLAVQFWTSRGFAVCDVNYGGSTGFGRAYRERLLGRWGEIDVADCVSAAQQLVADAEADRARLIITGGSAGGFTTLCALTFHEVFAAGASHYGVSDLEALAADTHKFESRYLDRLVGPYPQQAALYRARSPIHHVERLSCPIIFFQGLEDAVVPPAQAEAMVHALRRKGLPVAYLTFAGEQHGFRMAATVQRVLRAELAFYGRVLGFGPPDGDPALAIENL